MNVIHITNISETYDQFKALTIIRIRTTTLSNMSIINESYHIDWIEYCRLEGKTPFRTRYPNIMVNEFCNLLTQKAPGKYVQGQK